VQKLNQDAKVFYIGLLMFKVIWLVMTVTKPKGLI